MNESIRSLPKLLSAVTITWILVETTGCSQKGDSVDYLRMADLYKSKEEWPFAGVDSFKVDCIEDRAIMIVPSGKIYALNGLARMDTLERGWIDEETIHIKYRDMGPVLDLAKKKCGFH